VYDSSAQTTKNVPPETRMYRFQGLAQFWASRADRVGDGTWHIRNTMSPDEYSGNSSDPPYTTAVAQITLRAAVELAPLVGKNADLKLKTVADGLRILYDKKLDYHPEHIGYLPNQTIKQADVVMLGYPLAYNMSETTQRNDLAIYAKVTDPNGPGKFVAQRSPDRVQAASQFSGYSFAGMTWAIHSVVYRDIGDEALAARYFVSCPASAFWDKRG
jgi:hypothetical protein